MVAVMNSRVADPSFDDKLLCMWIGPCLCCGLARLNHCKRENVLESQGPFDKEEFNPLNAELNPICHLLALLGAHHIFNVGRVRVNKCFFKLDFSTVAKMLIDERQLTKLLNEWELIGASEVVYISMPVMNCTFHWVSYPTWQGGGG